MNHEKVVTLFGKQLWKNTLKQPGSVVSSFDPCMYVCIYLSIFVVMIFVGKEVAWNKTCDYVSA
jgi:hypothetical protein